MILTDVCWNALRRHYPAASWTMGRAGVRLTSIRRNILLPVVGAVVYRSHACLEEGNHFESR